MNNNKKLKFVVVSVAAVGALALIGGHQAEVDFVKAGQVTCSHNGNHYERLMPTDTTSGYQEFWACCDCHQIFLSTPASGSWITATNPTIDSTHRAFASAKTKLVSSLAELNTFVSDVNGGSSYEGYTVRLTASVNLESITSWTPIGTIDNPFKGIFECSDNVVISNLTIDTTSAYAGFFGVIDGGEVYDLTFENASVTSTGNDAGIVAGRIINGGKISHTTTKGTVTGAKRVGGVVGSIIADGIVSNNSNEATVTATTYNAGGIVGAAYYTKTDKSMGVSENTNSGNITAPNDVGGIVGLSAANVVENVNNGTVTGNGSSVGGIAGEQKTFGSLISNENNGAVTNNNATTSGYGTGGIVGWVRYHLSGEASAYEISSIIVISSNVNNANVVGANDAGGIVGVAYNSASITSNENKNASNNAITFAAGIVANYQITETPASAEAAANVLTFKSNVISQTTANTAINSDPEIYTNGNPIVR